MPTITTNFNLVKPGQQEFYKVDVPNSNMDTIDGVLKALQDAISSGASEQDLTALRNALTAHLTVKSSVNEVGHVQLSNSITGTSETKAATEKAVSDALSNAKEWGQNAVASDLQLDPNTATDSVILTNHANSPGLGLYWYIQTYYYANKVLGGNRGQIAITYNGSTSQMFTRHTYNDVWTPWRQVLGADMLNKPWGPLQLDGNGAISSPINHKVTASNEPIFTKTTSLKAGSPAYGGQLPYPGENQWSPELMKIRLNVSGSVRVFYVEHYAYNSTWSGGSRLLKNGVVIHQVIRNVGNPNRSPEYVIDVPVSPGDVLSFQTYSTTLNAWGQILDMYLGGQILNIERLL